MATPSRNGCGRFRETVQVNQGSLYPALHRLAETLVESGVASVGNGPRGQVLFADASRSKAARRGEEKAGIDWPTRFG